MAESFKVLGQSEPAVTTLTDVYTVPVNTQAVISSVSICNTAVSGSDALVRVSIAIAGAADTEAQYILYDFKLIQNDTQEIAIGMTLDATDVVRVESDVTDVAFNIFGSEIT